jgi:hypothetical protein
VQRRGPFGVAAGAHRGADLGGVGGTADSPWVSALK